MPKYTYIIKTTGPIVRGQIEAEDLNDAIQTIEERNKEKGRQILAWIGPYSEEELASVNVNMIKNMNNTIQLEQSQLGKLVAECTRTVLKEMELGIEPDGLDELPDERDEEPRNVFGPEKTDFANPGESYPIVSTEPRKWKGSPSKDRMLSDAIYNNIVNNEEKGQRWSAVELAKDIAARFNVSFETVWAKVKRYHWCVFATDLNESVNKVKLTENDLASMVAEGVKRVLREMREPDANQEQLTNLCIEYLNKSKELGDSGDYEGSDEMRNKAWGIMDGLDASSLEKVYNATQVNLKEGFGAGMKAVGQRAANDVKGAFGGPYRNYPGNYVDTFKDASYGEDYWKLGKALENGQQLDPNKVIKKVQKYANFGVISQDSAQKVIGLINSGDYQAAGHELCFGTMSMVDPTGETGKTGYEKRHGIKQM